jgi:hypothetical protein
MMPHEVVAEVHVGRRDPQRPSLRHRVACVDRKVEDELFDFAGVGFDGLQPRIEHDVDMDVLADKAAEHLLELGDRFVHIEHPGTVRFLAAEREELPREPARPIARFPDFVEIIGDLPIRTQTLEEQIAVTENRRQEIVEIVRDAAGKPADRFHFLRLREFLLEPHPIGDVSRDAQDSLDRIAVFV